MNKYIITFGGSQLQEFDVRPMDVMLVLEADTEEEARQVAREEFNNRYSSSYQYEKFVHQFKKDYNMVEFTLNELMEKKR